MNNLIFLDTNILLQNDLNFLNNLQFFYISSVSLEQLENIKTSIYKDDYIKYKTRKAIKWLINNQDKYSIIEYNELKFKKSIKDNSLYIDSNDKKIILTALYLSKQKSCSQLTFYTNDLYCYLISKTYNLNVKYITEEKELYKGYSKIICKTEEELAQLYLTLNSQQFTEHDFNINEYIFIYDANDTLIDKYKYLGEGKFQSIPFVTCNSKMFGKIKPKDVYQQCVLDSFKTNQLTLVTGPAGSGKSLLSLSYLFMLLEDGLIDRIILFCNTVATAGSAKLGFYPGDRTEKLLDSQIGNFLISKIGAREGVERLISEGQLLLLPLSDIRGFDTSGMRAGIYITEAQNLNIDLMKLVLQRIGQDSICILDGDFQQQVDLAIYANENNGLKRVSEVFKNHNFYGQVSLEKVYRSKIAYLAQKM